MKCAAVHDNGGRRTGLERREISYTYHIPERRCGRDRRMRLDRRKSDLDRRAKAACLCR